MGVKNFKLYFNHPKRQYYSGDTLTVQVKFFVDSPINLKSLKCKIKGMATTCWTVQGYSTTIYTGEEIYFDNPVILLQKPESEDLELDIGDYSYEISFDIPDNLPPTYKGKKGQVKYFVTAILDRPWKINKTTLAPFVIKQHLDLNQDALLNPNIREPVIVQLEEEFCCCFNRGRVTALVKLPYRGFVRGQKVPITLEIENESTVHVHGLRFEIIERDTFFTTLRGHKKEKEEKLLSGNFKTNVQARASKNFTCELCMPNIPFVNLRHCQVIDVDYVLKLELDISSGMTLPKEIPITFGTVQLNDFESVQLIDPPPYDLLY